MSRSDLRKRPSLFGVAHNDADYKVRDNGKTCPYYTCWYNMVRRCYDEKCHIKHPTYRGCTVCNEWLIFSNFKSWMQGKNWQGRDLDKDLFGDGTIYSADTCGFISKSLNRVIKESPVGKYPLGVSYKNKSVDMKSDLKNCYQARVSYKDSRKQLGVFETPLEAHKEWQKEKVNIIIQYSHEEDDKGVIDHLILMAARIQQDIVNNRITKTLKMGGLL